MKPEQPKPPNPDDVLRKLLSTPPKPHKKAGAVANFAPKKRAKRAPHK